MLTMRREDLLEKLVTTLHLSVPERRALGRASVPANEVAAIVKRLFESNGVFPITAKAWQQGEPVFEGFFLAKKPQGGIQLTYQRSDPINSAVLADQKSWEYDDVDDAISRFILSEWSKGIDGIKLS
jgi:hypothetical protein